MNVLMLTNELNRNNGWATVGYYLHKYLPCERMDVVTQRGAPNETSTRGEVSGLLHYDDYHNAYRLFRDYRRIAAHMGGRRIDLIICNVEPYLPLAFLMKRFQGNARPGGVRIVLIGHGTYVYFPFMRGPGGAVRKWFASGADLIVVPSRYTADKVREWYEGEPAIVSWGVDTDLYHPVGGIDKIPAFISVGSQKERKGTGYLLKAFKELTLRYPEARLYMVGPSSDFYIRLSRDLGLMDNVVFTGEVSHDQLLRYFSMSMCHVLPSVNTENAFEGFGLVHLEANACGVPSIGSLGTANEEVIRNDETGFLCPQRDTSCLVERMSDILGDANKRQEMSGNALEFARRHTWRDAVMSLGRAAAVS